MAYPETITYLESFVNYEKIPFWSYKQSLRLRRFKDFLTSVHNPQSSLRCIHVAGSKGKGSTCAFIAYILREAGFRVGLYTSPHLSDFRERIRILPARGSGRKERRSDFEGMISKNELCALVERLRTSVEKYNRESQNGPLSFFEVYTALAFVYFKEKETDFVVLETGLGGRLDATNTADALVSVITPISYEHTQKLGNTLEEIAAEKAGIIKSQKLKVKSKNLVVISAPQEKEAVEVIKNKCKKVGVKLYEVGRDILYEKSGGRGIRVRGIFDVYPNLAIRLKGEHQLVNAVTAVAAIEALRNYEVIVGADSIRRGLLNTVWPGRCEVVSKKPWVVFDGAQNVASCRVLKEAIRQNFKYKRLILVLGISDDKDIKGMCQEICPFADAIILTRANNPRATNVDTIEHIIREQIAENRREIFMTSKVSEAIGLARERASPRDLILVTGSLFVVGEARAIF